MFPYGGRGVDTNMSISARQDVTLFVMRMVLLDILPRQGPFVGELNFWGHTAFECDAFSHDGREGTTRDIFAVGEDLDFIDVDFLFGGGLAAGGGEGVFAGSGPLNAELDGDDVAFGVLFLGRGNCCGAGDVDGETVQTGAGDGDVVLIADEAGVGGGDAADGTLARFWRRFW